MNILFLIQLSHSSLQDIINKRDTGFIIGRIYRCIQIILPYQLSNLNEIRKDLRTLILFLKAFLILMTLGPLTYLYFGKCYNYNFGIVKFPTGEVTCLCLFPDAPASKNPSLRSKRNPMHTTSLLLCIHGDLIVEEHPDKIDGQ
jgi:hypothetical protein